jgi:hypothetical protein
MAVPEIDSGYVIDPALKKLGWDTKLQEESATGDLFSDNMGIYNDDVKTVPDAVVMKVTADNGVASKTLGMLNRLSGAGLQGDADLRGEEDVQATREVTIYANEWFNGLPTEKYGLSKVGQDPYAIYPKANSQLSLWAKEMKGKKIRQALCEFRDSAQTDAAGATTYGLGLASRQHPNLIIGASTTAATAQVTYDSTPGDYDEAIGLARAAVTPSVLTIAILNKLEQLVAADMEIEPVSINGKPMWIVLVPSRQKANLRAPGTGTLFELLKDGDVRGENNRAIRNVLGMYGQLLLVEDMRAPTVTFAGGTGTWTQTYGYKGAGQADGRAAAAAGVMDVAMVLGKGALMDFVVEPIHFETEVQRYGRRIGIGAFQTSGVTRADYDVLATPTDTSIRNQSSAVLFLKTI